MVLKVSLPIQESSAQVTGSVRERSGHRLLFPSSTWHSSIAILKCLPILGPLLCPYLTSVTLCWAVWMAEHTALSLQLYSSLCSATCGDGSPPPFLLHFLLLSASRPLESVGFCCSPKLCRLFLPSSLYPSSLTPAGC